MLSRSGREVRGSNWSADPAEVRGGVIGMQIRPESVERFVPPVFENSK